MEEETSSPTLVIYHDIQVFKPHYGNKTSLVLQAQRDFNFQGPKGSFIVQGKELQEGAQRVNSP